MSASNTELHFERLLAQETERLLRTLVAWAYRHGFSRQDAEDLVQQTVLEVWRKRIDYQPHFPFWPWLRMFGEQLCRNFARGRGRISHSLESLSLDTLDEVTSGEAADGEESFEWWIEWRKLIGSKQQPGLLARCFAQLSSLDQHILQHSLGVQLWPGEEPIPLVADDALAEQLSELNGILWRKERVVVRRHRALSKLSDCLNSPSGAAAAPTPVHTHRNRAILNAWRSHMPQPRHDLAHPHPVLLRLVINSPLPETELPSQKVQVLRHVETCTICQSRMLALDRLERNLKVLGAQQWKVCSQQLLEQALQRAKVQVEAQPTALRYRSFAPLLGMMAAGCLLSVMVWRWNPGVPSHPDDLPTQFSGDLHSLGQFRGVAEVSLESAPLFLTVQPRQGGNTYDREPIRTGDVWHADVPADALVALFVRRPEWRADQLEPVERGGLEMDSSTEWQGRITCFNVQPKRGPVPLLNWQGWGSSSTPWLLAGEGLSLGINPVLGWAQIRCEGQRNSQEFVMILKPIEDGR